MSDRTTTSFPKMGQYPSGGQIVNASAAPSPNTIAVPRKNSKDGRAPDAGTATHRKGIQERLGAKLHPQATLYAQNAAEASATGRNVYRVRASVGNRDFYDRRMYGQTGAFG